MRAHRHGAVIEFPKISYAPLLFIEYCAALGEVVIVPDTSDPEFIKVKVDWPDENINACVNYINSNLL